MKNTALILLSIVVSTQLLAETVDSNNTTSKDAALGSMKVYTSPISDSQEASIEMKRNLDNVSEVISSDSIGRFPDKNLADTLTRVPGLAIERDQGQARFLNFRGMPFRYTKIAFDGIDVPGAENGRIPRFDSFPSAITSKLIINKAQLPSMPGDAIAGYIDIKTFSPFDKEGFSADIDLGYGKQDLGDGDVLQDSVRLSYSKDNFGAVGFYSKNSNEQITDNREYTIDDSNELKKLSIRSYKVKRESEGYGGKLEYQNNDNSVLKGAFISYLYSKFLDTEQRNHYDMTFSTPIAIGTAGTDSNVSYRRLLEYGTYENSTANTIIGGDFNAGDWDLKARYAKTKTKFDMYLPLIFDRGATTSVQYDLGDILDPITRPSENLATDNYPKHLFYPYVGELHVDEDKYKLDAERELELFNLPTVLKSGLQYDNRKGRGFASVGFPAPYTGSINANDYATNESWYEGHTTNSINGVYYDNEGLRKALEAEGKVGYPTIPNDQNRVAIDEKILAGYVMFTTEFNWGDVIYGARIENTDYTSAGYDDNGTALSYSDTFTNVLPSVHANVDLRDDLKLRVSATTGISRPTYNEWRVSTSKDITSREAKGGNPELKAEESIGLDSSLEWYLSPGSMLSVGLFSRMVDNVIYADSTTVDGALYGDAGNDWTYTGTVNGSDGHINGIEASFALQVADIVDVSALDGFGVLGSITSINSEFKGIDGKKYDMPGTSDLLYNASLYYENYGVSARLNYTWRDQWISPIEDPEEYWDAEQRLDMKVAYELPYSIGKDGKASLYFQANNLTDENDLRYAKNGTVNQSESYGSSYVFGVRASY